jgi:glucan 1,4-alpha-glucosidase
MDAFQFIRDVAVDWDDTKVLDAEPGDFIVVTRKAKARQDDPVGRGKGNWFLGAITDENGRSISASLNFLDENKKYIATIYRDADNAHWKNNPEAYVKEKFLVDNKTTLQLKLAPGGGAAISLIPTNNEEAKHVKKY